METRVRKYLENNNIKYEAQKTFDWLIHKKNLYCDFFLPDYNVVIECQGIQHYEPVKIFGGEEAFKENIDRDKTKKMLCKKHNIKILYYTNKRHQKDIDEYSDIKLLIKEATIL